MPFKQHPTDPDKGVYVRPQYNLMWPKREWIGLTRQETTELGLANLRYLEEDYDMSGVYDFTQALESKLKEKNT